MGVLVVALPLLFVCCSSLCCGWYGFSFLSSATTWLITRVTDIMFLVLNFFVDALFQLADLLLGDGGGKESEEDGLVG